MTPPHPGAAVHDGRRSKTNSSSGGRLGHHDGDDCVLTPGADDLDWAARWLVYQNSDFDVLEPPA